MKTKATIMGVLAILAVGSYVVPAMQRMGGMQQNSAEDQDPKKMAMCPMHMEMCKSMMSKQVIATGDGGVAVLAGNRLMKYDGSLQLVAETEIKMNMEQMQQKIQKMMQQCPMHQQMMKKMQQQQDMDGMQNQE